MKKTLLILAAGMGSRYGGLKQIDKFGPSGESIIDYSIYDAIQAGFEKVVFVIRKSFEKEFREIFDEKLNGKIEVNYVFQEIENVPDFNKIHPEREKPWGTGHAVLMAKDIINEPFVIINADDFYGRGAFETLANYIENSNIDNEYSMVGYKIHKTLSDFGTVSRGVCEIDENNNLLEINERTKILKTDDKIHYFEGDDKFELHPENPVSMNCFVVKPNFFEFLENDFNDFFNERSNELKSEFYFPFVISDALKNNKISVKVLKTDSDWFGVTYSEEKEIVSNKIKKLVENGIYPKKLWEK